jgi:hypothetical protein
MQVARKIEGLALWSEKGEDRVHVLCAQFYMCVLMSWALHCFRQMRHSWGSLHYLVVRMSLSEMFFSRCMVDNGRLSSNIGHVQAIIALSPLLCTWSREVNLLASILHQI